MTEDLSAKLREACKTGNDELIIQAFAEHIEAQREQLTGETIIDGKRVLTWFDVVNEVKNKTPYGQQYLSALKRVQSRFNENTEPYKNP